MKKLFGFTITLFCVIFLFFTFTFNTAFADSRYTAALDIEGEIYNQTVTVDTNKRLRIGKSFYDFVEEKLNLGYEPRDILNYISPNLGTAYYLCLEKKEIQPVNAELKEDFKNRKFDYIYGKSGKLFDKKEACLALAKALDGEKQSLRLKDTLPEVTVKKLKERTTLMGKFTTAFPNSTSERKHNISLASSFIHGTVLKSGEEFSFNSVVGERTEKRGFKNAKVISDGEYIDGIGGGVCQLATTLYNAVLYSGLKVKKVSRHTFAPSYVSASRDAMVSSYSDFCFVNDTDYDVYIFSSATNESVTVSLYGLKHEPIQLQSVKLESIPFINVDKNGNALMDITDKTLVTNGIEGIKSELYIVKNGEKIRVRSDFYKSKNAIYE